MIRYVMVGSNDVARAEGFYAPVLAPLGFTKNETLSSERGPWFSPAKPGPMFVVCQPYDQQPATAGNGSMTALSAPTREAVEAVYSAALAAGGSDEGAPGDRGSGFYGAYFRDLDGNKVCVFKMG